MVEFEVAETRLLSRERGPRNAVDPDRPYAFFVEKERTASGEIEDVATLFLTNKECPFRCVFCDLWRNTTTLRTPPGAIVGQIRWALSRLPWAPRVKLYNSGNFFDEQAVPREDRDSIAALLQDRKRVTVECHPRLVDRRCTEFARSLAPKLEVAMGLETIDPKVLPRLDKGMTLDDFERSCAFLRKNDVEVRAFNLLPAPFQTLDEGVAWSKASIEYAFDCGVGCCAVIPLRADAVIVTLAAMEEVLDYAVGLGRGRVFMDLWDIERCVRCPNCGPARAERMRRVNLEQTVYPRIACDCGT